MQIYACNAIHYFLPFRLATITSVHAYCSATQSCAYALSENFQHKTDKVKEKTFICIWNKWKSVSWTNKYYMERTGNYVSSNGIHARTLSCPSRLVPCQSQRRQMLQKKTVTIYDTRSGLYFCVALWPRPSSKIGYTPHRLHPQQKGCIKLKRANKL